MNPIFILLTGTSKFKLSFVIYNILTNLPVASEIANTSPSKIKNKYLKLILL